MKRGIGEIKRILRAFVMDALYQLLGWSRPHNGKLVLTNNAATKMREHQLNEETLQDVFRFGQHNQKGDITQVTRNYQNYSVGLWYKVTYTPYHHNLPSEKRFLVITCWKGGER